jgi:hypothetical protein
MINWHTEKRKLKDLKPAKYNPNEMSESELGYLRQSLEKFGYVETIDINLDNTVIGGHQRLKVLTELGYDEAEVRVPDRKLNEAEEKELNLSLNKFKGQIIHDMLLEHFEPEILENVGYDLVDLGIEVPDIESVVDINESMNFIIKCEDQQQLEDLKKRLRTDTAKMDYHKFIAILNYAK